MNKDQLKKLEADLWSAADKLRANSDLKSSEYATPVLGLIFLKFADNNYRRRETKIHAAVIFQLASCALAATANVSFWGML